MSNNDVLKRFKSKYNLDSMQTPDGWEPLTEQSDDFLEGLALIDAAMDGDIELDGIDISHF